MQRSAPASNGVLFVRVQLPTGHQKHVKLEALEHVSPCAEDIHQLVRSAASGQPREVLTPFTIAGYLPPVNGHHP